ncbi:MAG: hypothetical protein ACD_26C00132G0001 [uncultured bacterium]|nr:MAG: hypothetical protein ACD_26C00132G0001 [uncultured bacterium]
MNNNNSKKAFRLLFAEKLMDLGNIVATAFVFSQFISEKQFSLQLFTLGFIIAIISYVISYLVIK